MKGLARAAVRIAAIGAVAIGGAAAVRAVLGRLSGEPGVAGGHRGSFDSWPVVPPAPDRTRTDGSRTEAGSGAH